jgi:protein O-mannosyl-transferase
MEKKRGMFSLHISREWTFIFILFLAVLAVYYRSLWNQLVNIDDPYYILTNPYIRDFSWKGMYRIFTEPVVGNYFPLQILSYALDFQLWRLQPFGYHLTNVLFHALNTVFVFLLLKKMFDNPWASFIAALLFGLHPVQVESVTWVSERKNVLFMVFLLPSCYFYVAYRRDSDSYRRKKFYFLSLFLFTLALLAKVSAVVLPLLLFLYDLCFSKKSRWEMIRDQIPFLGLSLFFSLITMFVYHQESHLIGYHGGTPYSNALAMVNVLVEYLISLLIPIYLDNYYQTPIPQSFFETQVLLSCGALALILFLAWRSWRRDRQLFFWAGWFFISLLPVLNIVPITILRADRYMYLAAVGFFYLLSRLFVGFAGGKPFPRYAPLSVLAAFSVIGAYGYLTLERNDIWKNSTTLWTDNQRKYPHHVFPYVSIGHDYLSAGQVGKAISYFQSGLQLDPNDFKLLNSLALAYRAKKDSAQAEDLLIRAYELYPNDLTANLNLGVIYLERGETEKAWTAFEKAIQYHPQNPGGYLNRAVIHFQRENWEGAIQDLKKAVELAPGDIWPYINLAITYERKGLLAPAEACLKEGLDLFPQSHEGNFHLGRICLKEKKVREALHYLEEAVRLKPDDEATNALLGNISRAAAEMYFYRAKKAKDITPQEDIKAWTGMHLKSGR